VAQAQRRDREGRRLQFRADVRVDLAIQANFLKSWCCPLHVLPPVAWSLLHRAFCDSTPPLPPNQDPVKENPLRQIALPEGHLGPSNRWLQALAHSKTEPTCPGLPVLPLRYRRRPAVVVLSASHERDVATMWLLFSRMVAPISRISSLHPAPDSASFGLESYVSSDL